MPLTPIAIVGRGCVLPGAESPQALWGKIREGTDLLTRPPAGAWPINSDSITLDAAGNRWSDRGGYIDGFVFDPCGFALDPDDLLQADRSVHWVLHACRAALKESNSWTNQNHVRTGAILGHLSLPLPAQAQIAISHWLSHWARKQGCPDLATQVAPVRPASFNRYMSALPTRFIARAIGLGGDAFTIDAACASSLYSIKLACDALSEGRADLMLAGASCGTDPMFLHIGFRALKALSPNGQSRPFHKRADGLVPSEGAVIFALKRLADAQAVGDRILGVIRGVGLSNDGGAAGLLVPSRHGQTRAMQAALACADLKPTDVRFLECHATGTPLGDGIELTSIAQAYPGCDGLPIGSIKSQIGHLLTVSGGAGLLKVLSSFEAQLLPRTLAVEETLDALASAPVRLLTQDEPWPASKRRIAGISSFGFGGNNAHLLVESYDRDRIGRLFPVPTPAPKPVAIAVIGVGVIGAAADDTEQFVRKLLAGEDALQDHPRLGRCGLANAITLAPHQIRFPPSDLANSQPQQTILIKAVCEALSGLRPLPAERTGVLVGMECEVEIVRQMARGLVPSWVRQWNETAGFGLDEDWMDAMCDTFAKPLTAAGVTGSLPNVVANRINAQFKLAGYGYSVCADEISGLRAIEIAVASLRRGELDAAIVAAVDLSCEPVTAAAFAALERRCGEFPGDAAVALVLKRLDDASRDGDKVLAVLDPCSSSPVSPSPPDSETLILGDGPGALTLSSQYGHAHAASGLLHAAAAVVACHQMALPGTGPAAPWLRRASERRAQVRFEAQAGQSSTLLVHGVTTGQMGRCPFRDPYPRIWHFAGTDRGAVARALTEAKTGGAGRTRIAFVARAGDEFERARALALDALRAGGIFPDQDWIFMRDEPLPGDRAVFHAVADIAASRSDRDLFIAFPELVDQALDLKMQPLEPSGQKLTPDSLLDRVHQLLIRAVLCIEPRIQFLLSTTHASLEGHAEIVKLSCASSDLAQAIEQAWERGVRIFVSHGAQAIEARQIRKILRGRDHLAVCLRADGKPALIGLLEAASSLWTAGVGIDLDALNTRTSSPAQPPTPVSGVPFASHIPPVDPPDIPQASTLSPIATPDTSMSGHHRPSISSTPSSMNDIDFSCATTESETPAPKDPLWSRADLEEMSHGTLSKFFGPRFKTQDGYLRQVRMPRPPLLLADRVLKIEGEPGSMGLGRIVTETDITADAWYLHEGGMPAGLEVEAGQADLLLISYLGADLLNRGERVYRLLGCEMTYHGDHRPRVGDTLRYEIEVTGHARTGDVRIFFFRYDSFLNGKLRLSVRNGRAGFFTDLELENAGGVIWDPVKDSPDPAIRHTATEHSAQRSFSPEQIGAFAAGKGYECFGAGFEFMASHHQTPRIQAGSMQLFERIELLSPHGGPWSRGYLRASYPIRGDEWFFDGHFHNDPTMPGTLMCEAGIQMMSFYLAALGHTIARDGWTFELVSGAPFRAACRGQVTPLSRSMTYELFVRGLEVGDYPTLWADVLLTVDGRKAFHGRNLGVRLWPGVPLKHPKMSAPALGAKPPAQVDGFTFDGAAMLHCATGLPSLAFGPQFRPFDGARNLPRLPSAPYQFMSRVTRCEGPLGGMQVGSAVEIEYDIPPNAWYFESNDGSTMPFAVLLEAALQPCGWLAAYMGVPLHCDTDLSFRNLDGDGTLLRPVFSGDGILRTTARCTSVARNGDTFIESFDVDCRIGETQVYTLKTVFGHFTAQALSAQKGLPASDAERSAIRECQGTPVDLAASANSMQLPRLAHGQLLMLDRVTGFWHQGGSASLGRLLAEFAVDPNAWFFKAHFYRDPVQPGSLGIEAMIQLLQFHMRERGLGSGFRSPRFEPLACDRRMSWKYRGQVLPKNRCVTVEMEIAAEGRDADGPWMSANAWLWVDGLRIYGAKELTVRIVEGDQK